MTPMTKNARFKVTLLLLSILVACLTTTARAAGASAGPCAGSTRLLALLDRPTVKDSACVVKPGRLLLEAGYTNQVSHGSKANRLVTYPHAEWRFGLPGHWEAKLFTPNYNHRTRLLTGAPDHVETGYGDTALGVKYEFGYFGPWTVAADTKFTLPSGQRPFSAGGEEFTVNGIVSYSVTQTFGVSGQLGISTLTRRLPNGEIKRFSTLSPYLVAAYHPLGPLQFYAEVYGKSNAGPGQGGRYALDYGVQYLILPRIEIDVEEDTQLSGHGAASLHYFGFGAGIEF